MGKKYLSAKVIIRHSSRGYGTVRQRYPFSLYAYALMSNHFHLFLEIHRFPTARILQSLLTGYARRFFSDASNIAGLESCQSPFCLMTIQDVGLGAASIDIDRMANSIQS